jgi:hypothetical protein
VFGVHGMEVCRIDFTKFSVRKLAWAVSYLEDRSPVVW